MNYLNQLTYFKDFIPQDLLNEGLMDAGQTAINRAFRNMGDIPLSNGSVIKPSNIIKVVESAIEWIYVEFPTYYSFARDANVIYMINNPMCHTMCVDEHLNIFMDVLFIYKNLKMDKDLVAAVIMHEIMHVIYNHIERGKNWLSANGKPLDQKNMRDTNLAADVEVNTTLVNKTIISQQRLTGEIHGLYLPKRNAANMPMESILDNEELMNKLRAMVDVPKDTRQHVNTSTDWDNGYKDGWDKIVTLFDKYGSEQIVDKLKEFGIIDKHGKLKRGITTKDIDKLNFITVKSYSEFVFESKMEENQNRFKTYDSGYMDGVAKAVSTILDALNDSDDNQSQQNDNENNVVPDSQLKPEDLKKLNLPQKEKKDGDNSNGGKNDNLPTNTNQQQNTPSGGSSSDDLKPSKDNKKGDGKENGDKQNSSNSSNNSDGQNGDENGEGQGGQSGQGEGDEKEGSQSSNNSSDTDGDANGGSDSNDSQSNPAKGGGNEGGESGSGDANTLTDDLKNKSRDDVGYAEKSKGSTKSEDTSVGDTGSFINDPDSAFAKKALKESGYSKEDVDNIIKKAIERNKSLNSPEGIKEKRNRLYSKLNASDPVKRYLQEIEMSEAKYQNIWKKIMRSFLGVNCRKAGDDKRSKSVDWKNKRAIARGRLGVRHHMEAQEPQDINIYVDVSGSVNLDMLEVIAKSLCILCDQYKYSGINIIPWATISNGVHKVESVYSSSSEKATKEILGYISQGISECQYGTELIGAFLPELISIVEKSKKKDDKHIIITDGQTSPDESNIENLIRQKCGSKIARNCFWMIYDPVGDVKNNWEKAISDGTLLFLNSSVVVGNG